MALVPERSDRVPSADELAAIAAAYVRVIASDDARPPREPARWALAGRLDVSGATEARAAAVSGSRWKIAGRLDG
ncbi:MAG TPA: hypothetical protein VGC96_11180 [Candidatus Elarobacter sp.]|jgi:hypothetical protein